MTRALTLASPPGEIQHYLAEIQNFPMLSAEEEYALARRLRDHRDRDAAHTLVTSHLRLVAKTARQFMGYGLRLMDLIQEGSLGLMQAVKKFDPDKGYRLATYALWWIRAAIQDFVLKNWSLVKIATTAAQKKLFFNLKKSKKSIERLDETEARRIGAELEIDPQTVLQMDGRLAARDDTLNRPALDGGEEIQNMLADQRPDQEILLLESEEQRLNREAADRALSSLNERERFIMERRIMAEDPATLNELGEALEISRERVRQLEKRALEKLRTILTPDAA